MTSPVKAVGRAAATGSRGEAATRATTDRHASLGSQVPIGAELQSTVGNQGLVRIFGGQQMAPAVRKPLERQFGRDLGRVRVHSEALARFAFTRSDSPAYTVGRHIMFAPGQYAPETRSGRQLLAHELVHASQQSFADPSGHVGIATAGQEREAEAVAARPYLGPAIRAYGAAAVAFAPPSAATKPGRCVSAADGLTAELAAANGTLDRSNDMAGRFASAGKDFAFSYWFAKLYAIITKEEIAHVGDLSPAGKPFVMHFIPVFYDMYAQNAERFLKKTPGDAEKMTPGWRTHFAMSRPVEGATMENPWLWLATVTTALTTGVQTHIQDDMPIALERAYRSYAAKYCDALPFDGYHDDFFTKNKPIFLIVQGDIAGEIRAGMGLGYPGVPVDPSVVSRVTDTLKIGLNIDEVFRWREKAWSEARANLTH